MRSSETPTVQSPTSRGGRSRVSSGLAGSTGSYLGLVRWLPLWLLPVLVVALTVAAYQTPVSFTVDVGSVQDQAYTRNFHGRVTEEGRDYRWSGVYGYVIFPGTGGGRPLTATLTLDSARRATVTIIVNGAELFHEEMAAGWQTVSVLMDERAPAALASRDTVIEVRAPDYRTADAPNEAKGLKLDKVSVAQMPGGGLIWPPYAATLMLASSAILLYLVVGRSLLFRMPILRARQYALGTAIVLVVFVELLLILDRVVVVSALGHSITTLLAMLAVLICVEWSVMRWWRVKPQIAGALGGLTALGFGLRYFGMALPQSVIIDMPWHMKWLRTLLLGDWQALYFPGGLSRVPAEWGLDLLIPKSPLFYFVVAPLGGLPVDLESAVKLVVCLLDASLVLVAYWLARGCGVGPRGSLYAAALYAVMPLAFRAFAYGILPTIFAQWLSAILLAGVAAYAYQKWTFVRWLGLITLATLALLAFPTVALFTTLVSFGASIAWWLTGRRYAAYHLIPVRTALLLVAGWLLAIVSYYGLYVTPVIASATALLGDSVGGSSVVRWPGGPGELVGWTADYVVSTLPWLIALFGLIYVFGRKKRDDTPRDPRVWLLATWLGIAPVFMLANYRVDMIGKHLFFTMLPVAALGAVFLWQLSRRQRWGLVLSGFVLITVGWQAVVFWVERLVRASS